MQSVEKHGAGSHVLRPDRVYATGVLAPMVGFMPGQDVQAVAADFTERSQNLGLAGLAYAGAFGAAGQLNFVEKMKLKLEAWSTTKWPAFVAKLKARAAARTAAAAAKANVDAAKATVKAINASTAARAHGQAFAAQGVGHFAHPMRMGAAYAQVGTQVAPHMMGQVQMLARLTSGSLPTNVAEAQVATTLERWHNLRWNG
jgi:hypothetical protein